SLLSEKQYSRLPVYRDSLDDVIGSIHIKDILAALARNEKIEIENLIRDVPIVSPAMHVLDLLLEMKQTRRHMALVVDEFGGIDGLVTVGDIIGAIVGEIEDEHEVDDQPQMTMAPDGTVIADGRVDVEELEEKFGAFLSDAERQDIDTLGGLVFAIAGRVPTRGEVLSHDSGLVFEVLDADPRRVSRLRIKNIPQDASSE
ncbi:MAG TPA: transporter associated domain-containing protein, partial [Micavibrio sp.]